MIKLSDYEKLYRHKFALVTSRMKPYNNKEEDWVDAVRAFWKVEKELFKDYSVKDSSSNKFEKEDIKGLELNAEQLFNLFHKHINQYKNHVVRYFIFSWWNDLRYFVDGAQPVLDCPWEYYKPATKEEIEQARIDFSSVEDKDLHTNEIYNHNHTFRDDAVVLEYRGNRFIIDNEWGCAWTKDKKGKVRSFSLEWDWWYPIDEYLDLENY